MNKRKILLVAERIICIIIMVMVILPFFFLISSAFRLDAETIRWPPSIFPKNPTVVNFITVWNRIPLLAYIKNTVIFALTVAIGSSLFDSLAGYAFARLEFRGRKMLFRIFLIAMMIPYQIVMIPLYIESKKLGILNTYAGLILPRIASAYGVYFMRSFFIGLPKDLEDSARIDGLNEFGIFSKIMFPLCRPAYLTLSIFILTSNWNDMLFPMMQTSATKMRTLPAGIAMFVGENAREIGAAMAATIISILPILILYLFLQRYFVEGIAVSGMKE